MRLVYATIGEIYEFDVFLCYNHHNPILAFIFFGFLVHSLLVGEPQCEASHCGHYNPKHSEYPVCQQYCAHGIHNEQQPSGKAFPANEWIEIQQAERFGMFLVWNVPTNHKSCDPNHKESDNLTYKQYIHCYFFLIKHTLCRNIAQTPLLTDWTCTSALSPYSVSCSP